MHAAIRLVYIVSSAGWSAERVVTVIVIEINRSIVLVAASIQ